MNRTATLKRVDRLVKAFESGKIARLVQHEVYPALPRTSRLRHLYFTLPISLNFQRSSPALWRAALATWNDSRTHYVFLPERVVETKIPKLKKDLTKHALAVQENKHTNIWFNICTTLHEKYKNDPRVFLASCGNDCERILEFVQTHKQDFPYLGGPKLSNYWVYILSLFTDVGLKNLHSISIIPDTHVMQSSIKLGIVASGAKPDQVSAAWESLLKGTEIKPSQLHSVLWNWSRSGFAHKV
jgi:hypothetical protein